MAAAWRNKGASLHILGSYQEAIACFDQAIELEPKDAFPWYNKGLSLDSLGRYQEAIACYEARYRA